jgi:hypothetical protein
MALDPVPHLKLSSAIVEHPSLALVHEPRENYVQCTAETAECTCPEFCERDHDRD